VLHQLQHASVGCQDVRVFDEAAMKLCLACSSTFTTLHVALSRRLMTMKQSILVSNRSTVVKQES